MQTAGSAVKDKSRKLASEQEAVGLGDVGHVLPLDQPLHVRGKILPIRWPPAGPVALAGLGSGGA